MSRFHAVLTVICSLVPIAAPHAEEPAPFFTGNDLAGWQGRLEYWTAKDGAIVGSTIATKGIGFNTFLCSKRTYKDFELSLQVRLVGQGANSGIQIRSEVADKDKWVVWGPQCDIGEGWWGSLYGEHFGGTKKGEGVMLKGADQGAVNKVLKKEDFNDYYVKAVGKHVTIRINGLTTVDQDFEQIPESGIIGLQIHSGGPMEVTFKDVIFKEIK